MPRIRAYFLRETTIALLVIFVLMAIAYLPRLGLLSYYGDDWHAAWAGYTEGPGRIIQNYSTDRPFMALVYGINYAMLGNAPLAWQLYAFLMRLIGAYGVYWLARLLWPRRGLATLCMAILFALYPGFLLMPNASTYQTLLFGLNLGIFSIIATVKALQSVRPSTRWIWMILTGVLASGTAFMFEWMIGMEGLRLAVIWLLLRRRRESQRFFQQLLAVLKQWIPAALGISVFLVFRLTIFHNLRPATDIGGLLLQYGNKPLVMFDKVLEGGLRSLNETIISAWFVPFYNLSNSTNLPNLLGAAVLAVLSVGIFIFVIRRFFKWSENSQIANLANDKNWTNEAVLIGFVNILTALGVVVILNREVSFSIVTYDRYTLTAIAGVAFLLVGLVSKISLDWWRRGVVIAALIALSVGTHYFNAKQYSDVTVAQRQFWWQLAWRAPQLKPGTVLVPYLPENLFVSDFDIFPEAMLIYYPHVADIQVGAQALNYVSAQEILFNRVNVRDLRTMVYTRDYDHMLLANYGYSSGNATCMHVFDNQNLELSQNEDPLIPLVGSMSHIDQIDTTAQPHVPEAVFFGQEPPHTWCYYYQKITLARQQQDWTAAAALADQAAALGYKPDDLTEWLPVAEAYANTGQTQQAILITRKIKVDLDIRNSLCRLFAPGRKAPANSISQQASDLIEANLCH